MQVQSFGPSKSTTRLFLFGSARYSENPRDVDILVVYGSALSPDKALHFRAKLIRKLKKYIAIPIHVILLSDNEEREVEFIKGENCRLLTRKDIHRFSSSQWTGNAGGGNAGTTGRSPISNLKARERPVHR